jgi:hypothetical protein
MSPAIENYCTTNHLVLVLLAYDEIIVWRQSSHVDSEEAWHKCPLCLDGRRKVLISEAIEECGPINPQLPALLNSMISNDLSLTGNNTHEGLKDSIGLTIHH